MTKKSAAQMKVVKAPQKTEEQKMQELQKVFDESKMAFLFTMESQIRTSRRIDSMLNCRDLVRDFYGQPKFDEMPELSRIDITRLVMDKATDTYKAIKEIVETFTLEDFMKNELEDFFEDLATKTDDVNGELDMLLGAAAHLSIQPYGGKMIKMHKLIHDTMGELGIEAPDAKKDSEDTEE